ncbi:hypothetical protein K431DRAFT_292537 [Polychaeton citri CBS 116435]|uniref:Uncharacterized protein n=1 Tax=Polychaeton citri CBS 116435 TaxID=1314669 RepID=A0A9P4QER5_9PEZI|nr:hypothetical protein K431DRAFT_292537 [Polychaeton citri CBS 116435]
MTTMISSLAFLSSIAFGIVAAQDDNGGPFNLCTGDNCENCPVSLASAGTGYPNCVVYNSQDVFPNHTPAFAGGVGGGWGPYIDVLQPDPTCQIIVKSPANTEDEGCGKIIASFSQPTCALVNLKETFMVQFCCGNDDCKAAGASVKRSDGQGGAYFLKDVNGTIIPPAQFGPMVTAKSEKAKKSTRPALASSLLAKRGGACTKNSWVADAGQESYTRPADGSQIVYDSVAAGQTVTITEERSVSFTQTLSASFGFEDIVDIGVSFSVSEEQSESKSLMFTAPAGQSGSVDFTPTLRCSTGTGTCDNGNLHGEVCSGFKDSTGKLAGEYTVVVHD